MCRLCVDVLQVGVCIGELVVVGVGVGIAAGAAHIDELSSAVSATVDMVMFFGGEVGFGARCLRVCLVLCRLRGQKSFP